VFFVMQSFSFLIICPLSSHISRDCNRRGVAPLPCRKREQRVRVSLQPIRPALALGRGLSQGPLGPAPSFDRARVRASTTTISPARATHRAVVMFLSGFKLH